MFELSRQEIPVFVHDAFTKISCQWERITELIGGLTSTEVIEYKRRMVSEDPGCIGYSALKLWFTRLNGDPIQQLRDGLEQIDRKDLSDYIFHQHQKPIIIACCAGDLTELKRLRGLGRTLNYSDPEANPEQGSPLHIAVRRRDRPMTTYILSDPESCDPNMEDGNKMTSLQLACKQGSFEIIKLLLNAKGIDVNCEHPKFGSALYLACDRGDSEVVTLLLEAGADATTTLQGSTLLHVAATLGSPEIAKNVIEHGADLNVLDKDHRTALMIACQNCDSAMVAWLLDKGADPLLGLDGYTTLHCAAANNALDVFKLLKEATHGHFTKTFDEKSVLDIAQENKSTDIVVYLICNAYLVFCEPGSSPLHWACADTEAVVFEMLSSYPLDLESHDKYGRTPLHVACETGTIEIVQQLLVSGSEKVISAVDNNEETPLHKASSRGHYEIALLLLDNGAEVDAVCRSSATPLHRACANEHVEVVQLLLNRGADPSRKDSSERSAFDRSANPEIIEILKTVCSAEPKHRGRKQSRVDSMMENPFTKGLKKIHGGMIPIKMMIPETKVDAFMMRTPLHAAAERGECHVVRFRVDKGAKVKGHDMNGDTPLHLAAANGHAEVCEILLEDGKAAVNAINSKQRTPLAVAAKNGHQTIVKSLLNYSADPNMLDEDLFGPLQHAVRSGHEGVVNVLLAKQAVNARLGQQMAPRVNHKTRDGDAALHIAAKIGNLGICSTLILKGAATHGKIAAGNFGRKPLHIAVIGGNGAVAELLLDNKANPDSKDIQGLTPLYLAVTKDNVGIVELLLERGADVNMTVPGDTPLHAAARMGTPEVVKMLLDGGAKKKVKNAKGKQPADEASSEAIALMIKSHRYRKVSHERPSELDRGLAGKLPSV